MTDEPLRAQEGVMSEAGMEEAERLCADSRVIAELWDNPGLVTPSTDVPNHKLYVSAISTSTVEHLLATARHYQERARAAEERLVAYEHLRGVAQTLAKALDYEKRQGERGLDTGLRMHLMFGLKVEAVADASKELEEALAALTDPTEATAGQPVEEVTE